VKFFPKQIVFIAIAVLLVLFLGFVVWLVIPQGRASVDYLIHGKSLAVLSLKLNLDDKGIRGIAGLLKDKALSSADSSFEKFLIRSNIWQILLPAGVTVTIIPEHQGEEIKYNWVVYLTGNRAGKLLKFHIVRERLDNLLAKGESSRIMDYKGARLTEIGSEDNQDKSYSYAFLGNCMLVSNATHLIEESVEGYLKQQGKKKDGRRKLPESENAFRVLMNKRVDGELRVFIQNGASNDLSNLISNLEDRFSYSIFPSIDLIDWIGLDMDIIDGDSIKSTFIFKSHGGLKGVSKGLENDVYFINETLRRLGKANGLDGKYTIEAGTLPAMGQERDFIAVKWDVTGIKEFLKEILSKEGNDR